ncbi:MAG TPA: GC-type dockerin domain-anchored protein [Phycisphaerales bacterium]|nr:GC-type dockerin domain-anchored protein [Phycisphaerales bacterium]
MAAALAAAAAQAQTCDTYKVGPGPATYIPGTTDMGNHSLDALTQITFPFPVSFYGTQYASATASTDGYLQFTSNADTSVNDCLPVSSIPGPALFPFWENLQTLNSGAGIFTGVSGAVGSRTFVVEWRAAIDANTVTHNFEIIFHENDPSIDYMYNALPEEIRSETVGLQASSSGPATEFECFHFLGASVLHSGASLRFTLVEPELPMGSCCFFNSCSVSCSSFCYTNHFVPGGSCTPQPCPHTAPPNQCWGYAVSSIGTAFSPGLTDIGNHTLHGFTTVALPFPVTVYGSTYNAANVSTDGYVEFGSSADTYAVCLPSPRFAGPTIFGYWDDLETSQPGQGIFTAISGPAGRRTFLMEWRADQAQSPDRGPLDFEIVFYEGRGYFDIVYAAIPTGVQSESVGAQGGPVGPVSDYACWMSGVTLSAGQALRFACGAQCAADFNGGGLSTSDIFDYLNAWFAGDTRADFNGADGVGVQDIFDFLNAWFAGC